MATRPVFVPQSSGTSLVAEVPINFIWHPGMAPSQKKKNVSALHTAAQSRGLLRLLEISSKSEDEIGRRLSAFSLKVDVGDRSIFLECAYQGSKVFRSGGPYTDLFNVPPIEAKRDTRLRTSGSLLAFEFMGARYPLSPKNAFYDWLYIKALIRHRQWITTNVDYQGFTDIEFNPEKSINCQARAFAELIALENKGQLDAAAENFDYFASLLPVI
jgi:hypothetical protein